MRKSTLLISLIALLPLLSTAQPLSAVWPKPGQTIFKNQVDFLWNAYPGAQSYEIEIYSEPELINIAFQNEVLTNQVGWTIPQHQNYYWRIRATLDDGLKTEWSSVVSFSIFHPSAINNLVFWISADNLIQADNKVSQWTDQSGSNNHVRQITEANKPTVVQNVINGNPVVRFNGTSQFLDGGDILDLGTNSRYIAIVGQAGANGNFISKARFGGDPGRFAIWKQNNELLLLYEDNIYRPVSAAFASTSFNLLSTLTSRTKGRNELFVNSLLIGSNSLNASFNMNTGFNFLIGAYNNTTGSIPPLLFHHGDIAEILIYNKDITPEERLTIESYLRLKYFPSQFVEPVNLGPDKKINYGFCPITLDAGDRFVSYLWSTGETTRTINAVKAGQYSVTVTDIFGFISRDTIMVNYPATRLNNIHPFLCQGETRNIFPVINNPELYTYLWSTGAESHSIEVGEAGKYWVRITDDQGCFAWSDTLDLAIDTFASTVSLGTDRESCSGNPVSLVSPPQGIVSYLWGTGATTPAIVVTESGNYSLTVTNANGCSATDDINITVIGTAPVVDFSATTVCQGIPTQFTDLSVPAAGDQLVAWQWDFGQGTVSDLQHPEFLFNAPGTFPVTLRATSLSTCSNQVIRTVEVKANPTAAFTVNTTCIGLPYQFTDASTPPQGGSLEAWQWNFGDGNLSPGQNPSHIFETAGTFNVSLTVTAPNRCSDSITLPLTVVAEAPVPEPFTMILPKSQNFYNPGEVLFVSNLSQNANQYKLQIAQDPGFDNLVSVSAYDPGQGVKIKLPAGKYYTRTVASNICLNTTISPVVPFTVFAPDIFDSLVFWTSADNLIQADNKVSQWTDQSGSNNHVRQLTEASKPTVVQNVINGKPVVRFNGTSQFLDGGDILDLGTNSRYVAIVGQAGANGNFISKARFGGDPGRFAIWKQNNELLLLYEDNIYRPVSAAFASTSFNLLSTLTSRTRNRNELFVNSRLLGSNTLNGSFNMNTGFNFLVGAYNNTTGSIPPLQFHHGDIAEILIYDKPLSDSERFQVESYLRLKYFPNQFVEPVNLGPDKNITYGFCPVTLDAGDRFQSYLWSTGATTRTISVNKPGQYFVTATDMFGFTSRDTIRVSYPVTRLNDSSPVLCQGGTRTIFPVTKNPALYTYQWSTGAESHGITVSEAGKYWVKITDDQGCAAWSDTLDLSVDQFAATISLGPDREFCFGNQVSLVSPPQGIGSYLWSTGTTTPALVVTESGNYFLTVTNNNGCVATDDINITVIGTAPVVDFSATTVCQGIPTLFTDLSTPATGDELSSWQWDFGQGSVSGEQHPEFLFNTPGTYQVTLQATSLSTCSNQVTRTVEVKANPTASFSTGTTCIGQPYQFTDLSTPPQGNNLTAWQWNFRDGNLSLLQNPAHSFETAATFNVSLKVTAQNQCSDSVAVPVTVVSEFPLPEDFTMILPKSQNFYNPGDILFISNISQNASQYKLQISDEPGFNNLVNDLVFDPVQGAKINLPAGQYYTRTLASNICLNTTASPMVPFLVFAPDIIDGLAFWISADNLIQADNKVSEWTDQSGSNNHVRQLTEASKPTVVQNVINCKPVVRFNGTSQFLDGGDILDLGTNSRYVAIVGQAGANGNFISKARFGSDPGRFAIWKQNNELLLLYEDNIYRPVSAAFASTSFNLLSTLTSRTKGRNELFINSLLIGSNSLNASFNMNTGFNFLIGAYNNTTGSIPPLLFHHGDIAEILIYNKDITPEERLTIESYLRLKYFPSQFVEPVNLGPDKKINYGFCPITLDAGERFVSYLWSTGETTASIEVTLPGKYSVTVTDMFGFQSSDEVEVRFPEAKLSFSSITLCEGDQAKLEFLSPFTDKVNLLWSTGSNEPAITVQQPGIYTLALTDTLGCSLQLSATVVVDYFASQTTLGSDLQLCGGDEIGLNVGTRDWGLGTWEGRGQKTEDGGQNLIPNSQSLIPNSQSPTTFLWSTGATTPTIPIWESGEYSVVAINGNGCIARDTIKVEVIGTAPEVDFDAPAVCLGEPMRLVDRSMPGAPGDEIVYHNWSLGDGSFSNNSKVEHLYTTAGLFDVSLYVETRVGCRKTIARAVQVYHLPQTRFTPNNACTSIPVNFTDGSTDVEGGIMEWRWSFRDGSGNILGQSTQASPTFTFAQPGNAFARLITTSQVGCRDTLVRPITVRESPRVDFGFTTPCLGDPVFFTDNTSAPVWALVTGQRWGFGDGNLSVQTNPSHLYSQPGIYNVTLSVTALNGCAPSLTKAVTVHSPPQVQFPAPDLCVNTPHVFTDMSTVENSTLTHWQWRFGDGGRSNEQFPQYTYTRPGQYQVSLIGTSAAGCSSSFTQLLDVHPAPVPAFSFFPRYGVAPLNVSFTNLSQGATQYRWDFGDGTTGSSQPNPTHIYRQNGIYQPRLVAVSGLGCSASITRELKVIPLSIDVAVTNVSWQVKGGFLELSATLMNQGTLEFDTLYLDFRVSGRETVRETWSGLLRPGEIKQHIFNARTPWNERLDFVCVEAHIPRLTADDNTNNNQRCVAFDQAFDLLAPWPNPAGNHITLGFVLPFSAQVTITLSDLHGHHLGTIYQETAEQGITTVRIPTAPLGKGIFIYRVSYREEVKVGKFMVW